MSLIEFFVVGLGGFIGSCFRYGLTNLMNKFGYTFPIGTLLSNVIAGFLIGFIIGLEGESVNISKRAKLFLTTGLLGGLSTFSTFSMETVNLFMDGKYAMSAGNVLLNLFLSIIGVLIGMGLARSICK